MIRLEQSLQAWPTEAFVQTLRQELMALPAGSLPLDQATSQGGYVDELQLEITVINRHDDKKTVQARIGVFFSEIVICCGCGDDPMPTNAYAELQVSIDKASAGAVFTVIQE